MAQRQYFRAFGRRSVSLAAKLSSLDTDWSTNVRVNNLGLGGAGLSLEEAVAGGALVKLEIVSPYLWDPLELTARLVWTRTEHEAPNTAGLQFQQAPGSSFLSLVELLGSDHFDA